MTPPHVRAMGAGGRPSAHPDLLPPQGASTARETPLGDEHETFPGPEANYQESMSAVRALREAIERTAQGQRDAVRLFKLQEMSLKEAAAVSGMSGAALYGGTLRAMTNLRKTVMKPGRDR